MGDQASALKRKSEASVYQCDTCDKPLTENENRNVNLKRHVKSVHGLHRGNQCKMCERAFSSKQNLAVHMSTVHQETTEDKTYGNSSRNLNVHVRSVHEMVRGHQCQLCGKPFSSKYNATVHLKTILAKPVKGLCHKKMSL